MYTDTHTETETQTHKTKTEEEMQMQIIHINETYFIGYMINIYIYTFLVCSKIRKLKWEECKRNEKFNEQYFTTVVC